MQPYQPWLDRLPCNEFPTAEQLNSAGFAIATNHRGRTVRFCDADLLPLGAGDGAYEKEISDSGRISTRPRNRHDLCNALVWARFPRLKAALNQRHIEALPQSEPGRRGPVRDVLTLFDECGMVVVCEEKHPLQRLAAHDWKCLFGADGTAWPRSIELWMVGHANLEKLQQPYPGMIAQCLLLHAPGGAPDAVTLDKALAQLWLTSHGPSRPGDLCAFPFAGVPGWWPGEQDRAFYANRNVFRPPRAGRPTPPLWSLSAGQSV